MFQKGPVMKTVKVGMLGIGNVGSGTYIALEMNSAAIEKSAGVHLEITKILNRHPERDRGIDIPKELYTTWHAEVTSAQKLQAYR